MSPPIGLDLVAIAVIVLAWMVWLLQNRVRRLEELGEQQRYRLQAAENTGRHFNREEGGFLTLPAEWGP